MAFTIGILSDTHGSLSPQAYKALEGSDLIIHAGDICSSSVLMELETICPVRAVLGNCDRHDYGASVPLAIDTVIEGLNFRIVHRPQDIGVTAADICVFGHTHEALIEKRGRALYINPGSTSRPRGNCKYPSVAKLVLENGEVASAEIIELIPALG